MLEVAHTRAYTAWLRMKHRAARAPLTPTPVSSHDRLRSHRRGLLFMTTGALVTYGIILLLLRHPGRLSSAERLDIGCFEFLGWWWLVYFTLSYQKGRREPTRYSLFTLRSYLDRISSHRGPIHRHFPSSAAESQDGDLIREKARSSRDVQGIMIAVVVLILTLVVIDTTSTTERVMEYHGVIRGPIFAVALIIILAWMLSLDVFDTILNSFQVSLREAYHLRRWFYRELGPFTHDPGESWAPLSGAVSYGYIGHALMPIFVLMVFSWFEPALVGFATALYVFLAYPYHYGYWAIKSRPEEVPKNMVKGTELQEGADWESLPDGKASVFARWLINRDGDEAIGSISGEVLRAGDERPDPCRWPPFTLGVVFVILSVIFA